MKRLTIDEVIAKYKEITNIDAICPAHCNISCDKCVQESEQLVEWLEELKALKNGLDIKCDNLNEALEKGKKTGYNKALDDFVNFANTMPTVEEEDGEIRPMWLEEMAKKLKAGGGVDEI